MYMYMYYANLPNKCEANNYEVINVHNVEHIIQCTYMYTIHAQYIIYNIFTPYHSQCTYKCKQVNRQFSVLYIYKHHWLVTLTGHHQMQKFRNKYLQCIQMYINNCEYYTSTVHTMQSYICMYIIHVYTIGTIYTHTHTPYMHNVGVCIHKLCIHVLYIQYTQHTCKECTDTHKCTCTCIMLWTHSSEQLPISQQVVLYKQLSWKKNS